ncbi:MAG: OmpA family protein [Gemmatimonadaceae bacterium]|nr:OmpA family protein [Gemmatimonadaceae bacterium]
MSTLLESLSSLAAPAVGPIAAQLGESDVAVSRGVQTSVASVLGGLLTKIKDPGAASQIFGLISKAPAGASVAGDVQGMVGGPAAGAPTTGGAGGFLSTLFGGQTNAVGDLIGRSAGFKNPSSGFTLLGMAAPLVLGFFGRKVRDEGLSLGGLTTMLAGERDGILAAAPAGLTNFLGAGAATPPFATSEARRAVAATGQRAAGTVRKPAGKGWIWPLAGIAALLLVWFFVSRGRAPAVSPTAGTTTGALDTAAQRAGTAVQTAAGEVGGLGAMVRRMLPGGVALNVPERGVESKLIAFIEDKSRPVDDTTWFDFDRVTFANGSGTILPQSQEQFDNLAKVLQAYPSVTAKIGGYTDSVGNAAANLRLSQQRAEAARQALIKDGVAANRLEAQGYGEAHPIADNSTDAGRARNRRIALRVTKK